GSCPPPPAKENAEWQSYPSATQSNPPDATSSADAHTKPPKQKLFLPHKTPPYPPQSITSDHIAMPLHHHAPPPSTPPYWYKLPYHPLLTSASVSHKSPPAAPSLANSEH